MVQGELVLELARLERVEKDSTREGGRYYLLRVRLLNYFVLPSKAFSGMQMDQRSTVTAAAMLFTTNTIGVEGDTWDAAR